MWGSKTRGSSTFRATLCLSLRPVFRWATSEIPVLRMTSPDFLLGFNETNPACLASRLRFVTAPSKSRHTFISSDRPDEHSCWTAITRPMCSSDGRAVRLQSWLLQGMPNPVELRCLCIYPFFKLTISQLYQRPHQGGERFRPTRKPATAGRSHPGH